MMNPNIVGRTPALQKYLSRCLIPRKRHEITRLAGVVVYGVPTKAQIAQLDGFAFTVIEPWLVAQLGRNVDPSDVAMITLAALKESVQ